MTIPNLRQPEVGDGAPNFALPATDGGRVTLSIQAKPVALIFMRHLA